MTKRIHINLPEFLKKQCSGNISAWARENGHDPSLVCRVIHGKQKPTEKLLDSLNVTAVTTTEYYLSK